MPAILLIEDNDDNRWIYSTVLEHHGHTVHLAVNGAEGVRMAQDVIPDVILLDIAMPTMTGWEAITLLKVHPRTAHIPVIALTAHALKSDEERAMQLGFDAFIRKPVEPKRVLEIVEEIVGRGG